MSLNDTGLEPPTPRPSFGPTETAIRNLIEPLGLSATPHVLTTPQLVRTLVEQYLDLKGRRDPSATNLMPKFGDRVAKSDGAMLDELKREKADALSVMLGGLPINREDLRDGMLGNITRFYVSAFKRLGRAERERQDAIADAKRLRDEANEAIAAKRRVGKDLAAAHEQIKSMNLRFPQSMTETDEEEPEGPDLPQTFIELSMAALGRFAEGYAEYGPGAADSLGLAGQWGDLHRKVMKLKASLWTGDTERLTRESETDILFDIMGHCLLALEMIERGMDGGRK